MQIKVSSKNPSRQEIEKIARTIVIHMKQDPESDPYDMIRSTGLNDNLMDTLLKKVNIQSFLHDFEGADEDPHSRDVGCPPLSLDKLFDRPEGEDGNAEPPAEEPDVKGISIKKKVVIPMSQAQDMQDMTKSPIGKDPEKESGKPKEEETKKETKKETKEASEVDPFAAYDLVDVERAIGKLDDDIYLAVHSYRGDIEKLASLLGENNSFEQEIARCHRDSIVTRHIFLAAGRELPPAEKTASWIVQDDEKTAELIYSLQGDLKDLGEMQDQRDFLRRIVAERHGE